jgi:hypothetical protein
LTRIGVAPVICTEELIHAKTRWLVDQFMMGSIQIWFIKFSSAFFEVVGRSGVDEGGCGAQLGS